MRTCAFVMLLAVAGAVQASAPLAQLNGASGIGVPELEVEANGIERKSLVLDFRNATNDDTPPILTWQLALRIVQADNATGTISFESATAHNPPFLGLESEFVVLSPPSDVSLVFQEYDTSFAGVVLVAGASSSATTIELLPSVDAAGTFILSLLPFNPDDPDHTSYWLDGEAFETKDFANLAEPTGLIEIAIIHVQASSIAGDFNNDTVVDAADYTVWRDGLGTEFTADDYTIWKQHFGNVQAPSLVDSAVPEPGMIVTGCLLSIAMCRRF